MKKKNIINLIKYHVENNEAGFRNEAFEVANDFDQSGDVQLAEYITSLLSSADLFVPQMNYNNTDFFQKIPSSSDTLWLSDEITQDLFGIVNAISHKAGVNKFLFQGAPGTGKTEAVKQLARILDREIYMVDFNFIIDSKLGQTQKNISELFQEINGFGYPDKVIILFDELDAVALDRTNTNDVREMGRAVTSILKGLDMLDDRILLIATTNLFKNFDKAIIRRFDAVIDFNRYSREDLISVAEALLDQYLKLFDIKTKNKRLFRKIIEMYETIPYPGDLRNLIKSSVAFSDVEDNMDYFKRIYSTITGRKPDDIMRLNSEGFSVREIEMLTHVSKSTVSRVLKGDSNE
ncbi:MAG TPA: AAA family ATPase [Lachnospiraceae bacterium]|nr:AAA family ATPase [Lachnospiraceae bacterium]